MDRTLIILLITYNIVMLEGIKAYKKQNELMKKIVDLNKVLVTEKN